MNAILFLDLETTGIEPENGKILEVAWRIEVDGKKIGRTGTEVAWWPELSRSDFETAYTWEMHQRNGLFAACTRDEGNMELKAIEAGIMDDLEDAMGELEIEDTEHFRFMLGGNSISFDKGWIQVHMPELYDYLHYRIFDVRALLTFFETCGIKIRPKRMAHRALDDINESMDYVDKFRRDVKKWKAAYEDQ